MLKAVSYVPASELDERIFTATVPEDHYLRRVKAAVNFDRCRDMLAAAYRSDQGRPAVEPLLLLKLEFLEYHYNLSDRQIMEQSRYNMAFRWFLGLSLESQLPHHTLLTYFRERLGAQKHQAVFDEIVGQARLRGLVKDRLRWKDATHVIANIAIPSTIRLVSQIQEKLLTTLQPWDPKGVVAAQEELIGLDRTMADLSADERLLQQVTHLRQLVTWAESVQHSPAFSQGKAKGHTALAESLQLAHHILADRESGEDTVRSLVDPDARLGKHGGW
jgi:transposase